MKNEVILTAALIKEDTKLHGQKGFTGIDLSCIIFNAFN